MTWPCPRTRNYALVTLIALTGRFRVIKAALDDLVGLTRWAGDTIWPAQLMDGLITLDIIDKILDIDLHGGLLSEIVEWDGVSIHHPQIHDPGIQYERRWKSALWCPRAPKVKPPRFVICV